MATVFVIDDDPAMLDIVTTILEAEGYLVETAADGEAALEKLKGFVPGIIVTDVMLPKLNGWQLCKKLKAAPATKNVPILVITAKGEDISELMSYESGADAYISKPFRNDEFLAQVKQLLEHK